MPLEVIGAGLGRTSTLSLKLALEHIGFGPCYHMTEVMTARQRNLALWIEAGRGNPDWDAIFEGYRSTTDYPGCNYWRELMEYYPQAKVILTKRDPDRWFDSVSETIMSPRHRERTEGNPETAEFFALNVFRGLDDKLGDREKMTRFFEEWNQSVIDGVPPERLLVFEARDGWEPLCDFLGVPVPDEPYPRVNSREEMLERASSRDPNAPPPTPEEMEANVRAYLDQLREKAFPGAA